MTLSRTRLVALVATLASLALTPLLTGCGSSDGGAAASPGNGKLEILDLRVDRPSLPTQSAIRMVVRNGTDTDDTLLAVSSPVAKRSSIHRSTESGEGVTTMKLVDRLPIPARSDVTFEPGGLHVMLEDITKDLKVGDTVQVTFRFAHAGTRTATAKVVEPGADAEEHDHG